MTLRTGLGLMLAALTSACVSQPPAVVIQANQPIPIAMGSSTLPAACLGLDQSRGMQVTGHSLYDVSVTLRTPDGRTILRAWAPANEGTSISTRVDREPLPGRPRCRGESLRTEVLKAADGDIMRWSLEIGSPSNSGVSGVVIRGETVIVRSGGKEKMDVVIGDMRLIADVSVTRAAWGILMDARDTPQPSFPQYGRSLPDESSGRTLEDMKRDADLRGETR